MPVTILRIYPATGLYKPSCVTYSNMVTFAKYHRATGKRDFWKNKYEGALSGRIGSEKFTEKTSPGLSPFGT
jgi:hypothetical protein